MRSKLLALALVALVGTPVFAENSYEIRKDGDLAGLLILADDAEVAKVEQKSDLDQLLEELRIGKPSTLVRFQQPAQLPAPAPPAPAPAQTVVASSPTPTPPTVTIEEAPTMQRCVINGREHFCICLPVVQGQSDPCNCQPSPGQSVTSTPPTTYYYPCQPTQATTYSCPPCVPVNLPSSNPCPSPSVTYYPSNTCNTGTCSYNIPGSGAVNVPFPTPPTPPSNGGGADCGRSPLTCIGRVIQRIRDRKNDNGNGGGGNPLPVGP